MAPKSSGAETPVETSVTASTEPVAPTGEPAQENNVMQELEQARARLNELQAAQEAAAAKAAALETERNNAIANALRADAMYRGLQNQTTKTLQKAAEDRRALAQAQLQAAEIGDIKSLLNTLASKVLDEDEAKELKWTQKELEFQRREQALAAKAVEPVEEPVATPQQYTTPEDEKAQFLSYYFPGVEIDPKDPNIDWGEGASSTPEAFRRFTTSVLKIRDQKEATKANDAVAELRRQAESQLAELKRQQDELAVKTAEEIAAAKVAAEEAARKEAEKRLRAMGADVSGVPVSDGGRRTLAQTLNEQLNDDLLRTPEGRKQYARDLEAVRQRVKEQFR